MSNPAATAYRDLRRRLDALFKKPENQSCCDCAAALNTSSCWATILNAPPGAEETFGAFICHACAESHKSVNKANCRVKTVGMEEWSEEDVMAMERGCNKKVNGAWEAKFTFNTPRPNSKSERPERDEFIVSKYVERDWFSESIMKKLGGKSASFGGFALKASSSDTASTLKSRSARRLGAAAAAGNSNDDGAEDYTLPLGGGLDDGDPNDGTKVPAPAADARPRMGRVMSRRMSARNIMADDGHQNAAPAHGMRRQGRRGSLMGSSRHAPADDNEHHDAPARGARPGMMRQRSMRRGSMTGSMPHRGVSRMGSNQSGIMDMANAAASAKVEEDQQPTQGVAARRRAARRSSIGAPQPAVTNEAPQDEDLAPSRPPSARGLGKPAKSVEHQGGAAASGGAAGRRRRAPRRGSVGATSTTGSSNHGDSNHMSGGSSSRSLTSISSDEDDLNDFSFDDDGAGNVVAPSSARSLNMGAGGGSSRPGRRGRATQGRMGVARTHSSQSNSSEEGSLMDGRSGSEDEGHLSNDRANGAPKVRRGMQPRTRSSRMRGADSQRPRSFRNNSSSSIQSFEDHNSSNGSMNYNAESHNDDDDESPKTQRRKAGNGNPVRPISRRHMMRQASARGLSSRRLATHNNKSIDSAATDTTGAMTDESENSDDVHHEDGDEAQKASSSESRKHAQRGLARGPSARRMRSGRRAQVH